MKQRKIVEVEWFDAQSTMDAYTIEELEQLEPLHTKSVGYLLLTKKTHIILGFMDFGNGLIKHHQCIPKGMIIKMTELRRKR